VTAAQVEAGALVADARPANRELQYVRRSRAETEPAEATPTLNWFLFDTDCGSFFYTADLDQALIEKTFQNLE
jgi:hypothetical protein